jgi:hypothetical protein
MLCLEKWYRFVLSVMIYTDGYKVILVRYDIRNNDRVDSGIIRCNVGINDWEGEALELR